MKYKFVHNGLTWWLVLTTADEVKNYFSGEWMRGKQKAIEDYERHVEQQISGHWANGMASTVDSCVRIRQAMGENVTFLEQLDDLEKIKYWDWMDAIASGKSIYVNTVGGYNFNQAPRTYEVRDECVFPCYREEDIRVKRWPDGKHYYAYVGNLEVSEGSGENMVIKWDTQEGAMRAARKYLGNKTLA